MRLRRPLRFAGTDPEVIHNLGNARHLLAKTAALYDFVGVEGCADLVHMGAVTVDKFVELIAGDAELFGPVGDV